MVRGLTRVMVLVPVLLVVLLVGCDTQAAAPPAAAPAPVETPSAAQASTGIQSPAAAPGSSPPAPGAPRAIIIGLDADLSSGSAESGEAIRRGIVLAIEEINQAGGGTRPAAPPRDPRPSR